MILLAILYALKSPNFHVEGITTCFGNNNAEQSAENSIRLLKLSGCGYEVPVVVGADESLDGIFDSAPAFIHGDNGIGNVILPESEQKPLDEKAEDFIIRKAEELDGELVIITTGRMTNLAKAYLKDPDLPKKVKKLYPWAVRWMCRVILIHTQRLIFTEMPGLRILCCVPALT